MLDNYFSFWYNWWCFLACTRKLPFCFALYGQNSHWKVGSFPPHSTRSCLRIVDFHLYSFPQCSHENSVISLLCLVLLLAFSTSPATSFLTFLFLRPFLFLILYGFFSNFSSLGGMYMLSNSKNSVTNKNILKKLPKKTTVFPKEFLKNKTVPLKTKTEETSTNKELLIYAQKVMLEWN